MNLTRDAYRNSEDPLPQHVMETKKIKTQTSHPFRNTTGRRIKDGRDIQGATANLKLKNRTVNLLSLTTEHKKLKKTESMGMLILHHPNVHIIFLLLNATFLLQPHES